MKAGNFLWYLAGIVILLNHAGCSGKSRPVEADVVIYGGTSAAVSAAVQLVRMDKTVIIVCPEKHLGGMTSSGLGFTDTGDKSVIGGISREFYQRVYEKYSEDKNWKWQSKDEYGNVGQGTPAIDGDKRTMWIFEPHIAMEIFEDLIRENKITVYRDHWLDRQNGVALRNGSIRSITMLNGEVFSAKIFIDATYEGDLMAAAGVSYALGREGNDVYNEQWNGVQKGVFHHGHHFGEMKISPYKIEGDSSSGLLPLVSDADPGINGEGDSRIQAYCFRMCLTKVINNRVPFSRPAGYDSSKYELLIRVLNRGWNETFQKFDPVPNNKTDVNNHGPFSFDHIGKNYDYPESSYEERAKIVSEHRNYQLGLLYFYSHDPRIPESIRDEMSRWGLAADEFTDNENWPYQLYIREARRMKGEFVMTENEVLGKSPVPKPVGMGSYTMDSHNVQRYITPEGFVQNEGDIGVHPQKPYQIDLGSILPRETECKNLMVPVAVSSSHIAYGSIRMEPVFMILGQSAGIVAGMAIDTGESIHHLDYEIIKKKLIQTGQVIEL